MHNSSESVSDSSSSFQCALCASEAFELLSDRDRHGNLLESVACENCGLVQHKTIPSDDELTQFYEKEYRLAYNGEVSPSPRRVVREWRRGEIRFNWVKHFAQPGDRVFEVGSGIGCNLKPFELYGCRTEGIEPGEGFCKYSRERLKVPVQQKFLFDVQPKADQDIALLVHVLEHLPNPIESLKHIRAMLKPEGYLYIEVPNFGATHSSPSKIFHYGHIFNFTLPTLRAAGEAAGFRVAEVLQKPKSRILSIMFQRREGFDFDVPSDGYQLASRAYHRFSPFTYGLRPMIWKDRVTDMTSRLSDFLTAKSKVKKIFETCEASNNVAASTSEAPTSRAA